jgi:hypothetical protein
MRLGDQLWKDALRTVRDFTQHVRFFEKSADF